MHHDFSSITSVLVLLTFVDQNGCKSRFSRFFCCVGIMLIGIQFAADFHNLPELKIKCLLVNIVIKKVRMSSSSTFAHWWCCLVVFAKHFRRSWPKCDAEFGRIFCLVTSNYFPRKVTLSNEHKMLAVPPHQAPPSSSSSLLLASSNRITLPGASTWEPPLWQHMSCLAWSLQVELTSQESGAGFDTSRGTTQGRFVLHSHCPLSHEDGKCHVRLEKQKLRGSGVPPSRAHLSNIGVVTFIWW